MRILITGVSSGLGEALSSAWLVAGHSVSGISRRRPANLVAAGLEHLACDLGQLQELPRMLRVWIPTQEPWDLVVLNAASLGPLGDLSQQTQASIDEVMALNVWSNKTMLDILMRGPTAPQQVLAISSGAALEAKRGLNAYCLTKSALKMLIHAYATEFPKTHFCSLIPGYVDTPMQTAVRHQLASVEAVGDTPMTDLPSLLLKHQPATVAERIVRRLTAIPMCVESGQMLHIERLDPIMDPIG